MQNCNITRVLDKLTKFDKKNPKLILKMETDQQRFYGVLVLKWGGGGITNDFMGLLS